MPLVKEGGCRIEASFGPILIGWFQFRKKWNSIEILEKVWLFLQL